MATNLPNSKDCEEAVLGSMLLDPKCCLDVLTQLNEDDFYEEHTSFIYVYRALADLNYKNLPIDIHTVADWLEKQKVLDQIGGINFLVSLTDKVTGLSNLNYYISILKDYSLMRQLITTVEDIRKGANNCKDNDFTKYVGEAERRITEITARRRITGFKSANEISANVLKELNENRGDSRIKGITTGFSMLDDKLNGLQKKALIILAARPSVGKSALALNIAYNAAKRTNKPVAFFSLEMANEEIMKRLMSNVGNVVLDKITKNYLNTEDRSKLRTAQEYIKNVPLYIDDTMGVSLEDLITKAKKIHNDKGGLGLIVIDYIGKIVVRLRSSDSKNLELDRVCGALKKLAGDLNVPVLALAQLNRRVEEREDGVPTLGDLKDSGSIEQDADQVMFLHDPSNLSVQRKKKFNNQNNSTSNNENNNENNEKYINNKQQEVTVFIAKNRNGNCGKVPLMFVKDYQRFNTLSKESNDIISQMDDEL